MKCAGRTLASKASGILTDVWIETYRLPPIVEREPGRVRGLSGKQTVPLAACDSGSLRLPASPLGFEPKARRFDSCLVFHSAEPELVGPCRTEVETEVVSAVRARESRLARRRCELRPRVPHEDAVSATSKLAQWIERRLRSRLSWVRLPHLR